MSSYLADRRKQIGLTQKEVADAVGVSEATVSRWESGEIANMRRDRIAALAKILGCSTDFVMTGNSEEPKVPSGFIPVPKTVYESEGRGFESLPAHLKRLRRNAENSFLRGFSFCRNFDLTTF